MADIIVNIEDRLVYPSVFPMKQYTNNSNQLIFNCSDRYYGSVDLFEVDAYIVFFTDEDSIDEVKITTENVDGLPVLTWDVGRYATMLTGNIYSQVVFKDSDGTVFRTYQFIVQVSESIDADSSITAEYPTILRQWEDRLNNYIATVDASIIYIPYGESIPPEDRIVGKLYFQYLDEGSLGQLQDHNGNELDLGFAPLNSPKFTGNPTAPTPHEDSSDTSVATTEFVHKVLEKIQSIGTVTVFKNNWYQEGDVYKYDIPRVSLGNTIFATFEQKDTHSEYVLVDMAYFDNKFVLESLQPFDGFVLVFSKDNIFTIEDFGDTPDIIDLLDDCREALNVVSSLETQIEELNSQISVLQAETQAIVGKMDFTNAEEISISSSNLTYTCPDDGYVQFSGATDASSSYFVKINGVNYCSYSAIANGSPLAFVSQGDVVEADNSVAIVTATFIPQK